jgi:hypothetical protein
VAAVAVGAVRVAEAAVAAVVAAVVDSAAAACGVRALMATAEEAGATANAQEPAVLAGTGAGVPWPLFLSPEAMCQGPSCRGGGSLRHGCDSVAGPWEH